MHPTVFLGCICQHEQNNHNNSNYNNDDDNDNNNNKGLYLSSYMGEEGDEH